MSLQVWLPLTKDLRQQGLSDVTVTNNGATFNSAGKLGGAYSFNGSSNYLTIPQGYPGANWSYSVWVYTTSSSATQTLGCCRTAVGTAFSVFLIGGKIRIDPGANQVLWTTNYTYPINTWFHFTVTCNNGAIKYYINGEYKESYSTTLASNQWGSIFSIGASQSNGSDYDNFLNGKINDVRIYDHCLSPMEVKEISKGLVLHYPLNRQGWGQENLITKYDTSFLSYHDGAVTLFNNQMNGGAQEIVSNINGASKCLHLHSNGGNNRQYNTLSVLSGHTYTISIDYYSSQAQSGGAWYGELNGGNYSWTGTSYIAYTMPNKWQRLSYTIGPLTSDAALYYFIACKNGDDCYVRNIKIEEGSIATPWSPAPSDTLADTMGLNSNIEYDTSGFNNNGTKTGTFSWTSDCPKYEVSTYFPTGALISSTTGFPTETNPVFTVNFWLNSVSGNTFTRYADVIRFTGSATMRMETENTTGTRFMWFNYPIGTSGGFGSKDVNHDEWHMYTWISDKTNLYTYVDGILHTTTAISGTEWTPSGAVRLGDGGMYMKLSDVRIYATALSANDVKSLYQNSAYIDSSGNVYGAVHSEV